MRIFYPLNIFTTLLAWLLLTSQPCVALPQPLRPTSGQLAAGNSHSLLLRPNGTLYAWGSNANGQLGNNSTLSSQTPVVVALPAGKLFVQVAASNLHSLALASDGTLYAWGSNSNGQLGNNSTTQSLVPMLVTMPAGKLFVQVAAGALQSLALASDGTLYGWGSNGNGQLGDNSTTDRLVPVAEASGRTQWRGIGAGPLAFQSLVLGPQGAVFSAGWNFYGQLGDGSTTDSPVFTRNRTPLPVELAVFTAGLAAPTAVHLAWTTASEKNSARFEVERSTNGSSFAKVGAVAAAGSSTSARTYGYIDATAPAGLLYYRLRQVDLDGTASYSPVRTVSVGAGGSIALWPNPTRTNAQASGLAAGAAVEVFDALGHTVLRTQANASGQATLALPAGQAAGLYMVRSGAQTSRLEVE